MNLENDFVINLLKDTGADIYLVGGVVRDYLLKKETHDKDIIVCDRKAKDFAKEFADKNDCAFVPMDEVNNIYRVVFPDKVNYIDITNPVNGSLEEDLKRRDLTINSLAINIKTGEMIDITGNGVKDINEGLIRAISEENIKDDPLRILRAFRFSSVLGFHIERNTLKYIEQNKDKILAPAVERINVEILKLFGGKYAHEVILQMDKLGLIDVLFPIMIDEKKVPPNTHHHLPLFYHSIETVKQIQDIYENSRPEVKKHLENIDFGGETRLAHLKFAGFLHDIGKFSTWTIDADGRHRFIGHDEIGAKLARGILKSQKFSKKQIEYVCFVIKHHMYASAVVSAPNLTEKVMMRYIRRAADNSIDLIVIAKSDRLSAQGPAVTKEMTEDNINRLNYLQDFYIKIKPTLKPLPKLLSGNDVMEELKLTPSPYLGEIVDALHNAQLEGNVTNRDEAIEFIHEYNKNSH